MRQELFSPLSRRSRTDATGARLQLAAVLLFDRSFDGRTHTSRVRAAVKTAFAYLQSCERERVPRLKISIRRQRLIMAYGRTRMVHQDLDPALSARIAIEGALHR